jgi:two-component system, NarL family, sensor kinase
MQKIPYDIIAFLLVTTILVLLLVGFLLTIFYLYRKKQLAYAQSLDALTLEHERNLLSTQLEIQEQTCQTIAREIHDNIGLSLTLAKLNLNTLDWNDKEKSICKIDSSIDLLSQSINGLSDISKSLNADVIIQHGLIKAIEDEIKQISQLGLITLEYALTGDPVYMLAQREVVIFRVIQEAFNNILKHSNANEAELYIHYDIDMLFITISDNGTGFERKINPEKRHAGLKNMETRVRMLQGTMDIETALWQGTSLSFKIPLE